MKGELYVGVFKKPVEENHTVRMDVRLIPIFIRVGKTSTGGICTWILSMDGGRMDWSAEQFPKELVLDRFKRGFYTRLEDEGREGWIFEGFLYD